VGTKFWQSLLDGPGNAQYTSPQIQNGILAAALSCLQAELIRRINKSECWSLLCDETTDRMKRELLCITIRYVAVRNDEVVVNEDPLCLVDAVTAIAEMLRSDLSCQSHSATSTSSYVRPGKILVSL
jgi:hypothetical protein